MKKLIQQRLNNPDLQVKNIIRLYSKAYPEEIQSGKAWYKQANEIASVMADKYQLSIIQTAGIISALSPGTNWSQNIVDANNFCSLLSTGKYYRSITVTTYGNNREKAYLIYCSPELDESGIFKLLLGASKKVNKTSSFFLNILHPDNDQIVTIDRHTYRINLGITEIPESAPLTEKRYFLMNSAYQKASKELEISAIELQAVVWLVFRRLYVTVPATKFEEVPF
jgi:hypothetical protein